MVKLLTELAPDEGYNLSPLPDVRFLRSNRALSETPVLYEPGIVVVVQHPHQRHGVRTGRQRVDPEIATDRGRPINPA